MNRLKEVETAAINNAKKLDMLDPHVLEGRFKQIGELLSLKLERSEFQEKWQEVVKGEMARKDLEIQLNGNSLQVQSA